MPPRLNIKNPPTLQAPSFDTPSAAERSVLPACRCCGGHRVLPLGQLPDAKVFAGARLASPLPGGNLYRCQDCHLVFRAPIHSKHSYDELYRSGVSTVWDDEVRVDHELIREALQTYLTGGSVLDIGCSTGNLLMPLTGRFATFGAEINPEAANISDKRGVSIVAHDLDDVVQLEHRFDAVVSCDVIEHVVNPLAFMRLLLAKTMDGGLVIVSTGNADAWSWRLLGSRFWYCYLPEHLSFVSPAWFKHHAGLLGADIVQTTRFVYSPRIRWGGKMLRMALMGLFRISPRLYYGLLPKHKSHHIPVGRGITRDHFVTVLRKRNPALNSMSRHMITKSASATTAMTSMEPRGAYILGSFIDACSWRGAIFGIHRWSAARESRYVCICNVHSLVTARRSEPLRNALAGADMATPDGMPVAWMLRQMGFPHQQRINGPDLMWNYCELAASLQEPIFLYGATAATLNQLQSRLQSAFPQLPIAGAYSPPFRALTEAEDEEITALINASGARVVFVSLGCPKQELWMAQHRGKVKAVMVGVGAAFDYHAGTLQRAPLWMQQRGLEWLYRLYSEPRRLWKRYFVTNSIFIFLSTIQLIIYKRKYVSLSRR